MNKNFRKLISILLVIAMLLSFVACGEKPEENQQSKVEEIDFSDKIVLSYFGTIYNPGDIIEVNEMDTITVLVNGTAGPMAAAFEVYTDLSNVFSVQKDLEHSIAFNPLAKGTTQFVIATASTAESFILTSDKTSVDVSSLGVVTVTREDVLEDTEVIPSAAEIRKLEAEMNESKNRRLHDKYGKDPSNSIKLQYLTELQMDAEVKKCKFPDAIGKRTLTAAQARELADKDPDVIADAIKTVADMFVYFKTVSLRYEGKGDGYTSWYGNSQTQVWGTDHPGEIEIYDNEYVCCGGMTNLGAYLLNGDYDEVGKIKYIGTSYHAINYIKQDGKYYIIDFVNLQPWYGWKSFSNIITVVDDLHDVYQKGMVENRPYFKNVMQEGAEGITAMFAYPMDKRGGYPSNWNSKTGTITFPTECEGKAQVIYYRSDVVKNPDKCISYAPLKIEVPGWNADYTNLKYEKDL